MHIRSARIIGIAAPAIVMLAMAVLGMAAQEKPAGVEKLNSQAGQPKSAASPVVTPVIGPSWLKLIGIFDLRSTAMGQNGGNLPPPPSARIEPDFPVQVGPSGGMGMGGMMGGHFSGPRFSPSELQKMAAAQFVLSGIDFYRLDCQSCHGPEGNGAPPQIKSLNGPVEAASAGLLEERMKKMGRSLDPQMAKELASQAQQSILQRLRKGGKQMPAFDHLSGSEIDALLQYLKRRMGAPEARGEAISLSEAATRVGEHLVKGTCMICHDAAGPGRRGMMQGIIPSLASFPYEQSMQGLVSQVELGSRGMMMRGPRMPAYPYITPAEAAAAYLYLVQYPPY